MQRAKGRTAAKWAVFVLYVLVVPLCPGLPAAQTASRADFDGDGTVGFSDFLLFARAYGSAEELYDLDGNGTVDFADFAGFAEVYGKRSEEIAVATPAGVRHEMMLVPAGTFVMGTPDGTVDRLMAENPDWLRVLFEDEQPAHTVYLDVYYIDKYEVTNSDFVAFLNEIRGTADGEGNTLINLDADDIQIHRIGDRYEVKFPEFANRPVVYVSWYGARAYCAWRAGRLPTEAEWEKAARGTDARVYPWGNEAPDIRRLNFNAAPGRTTDVGSYPPGASPYGVYDMAGNAYEWCADWYDSGYYARSPKENPRGAETGEYCVLRGGSWQLSAEQVRAMGRDYSFPSHTSFNFGFRCVHTPE